MPIHDNPDHRRTSESGLLLAIGDRDPLALAEAYHRVGSAAFASARRLLGSAGDAEAVVRGVFAALWTRPPDDAPLEGWVRARAHELGVERLAAAGRPAASPSAAELVPELGPLQVRRPDAVEQALADLEDRDRRALVLAHDHGVPSSRQGPGAGRALVRALTALAGPDASGDGGAACDDQEGLADWVLGLLPADRAESMHAAVAARPDCTELVRTLRRGRRRLEGLPPTGDAGQRILVAVVAGLPVMTPPTRPSARRAAGRVAGRAGSPGDSVVARDGGEPGVSPWAPEPVAADPPATAPPPTPAQFDAVDEAPPPVAQVAAEDPVDVVRTTRRGPRHGADPLPDGATGGTREDVVPSAGRRAAAAPHDDAEEDDPGSAPDGAATEDDGSRTRRPVLQDGDDGDASHDDDPDRVWAPPRPLAEASDRAGADVTSRSTVVLDDRDAAPTGDLGPSAAAGGSTRAPARGDDDDDADGGAPEEDRSSVRSTVLTIVIALLSIGVGFVVVSALLSAL